MKKVINYENFAKNIIDHCLTNNIKYIFIIGNSCSGKTTLSNIIKDETEKLGKVNIINMDDFIVNKKLRDSALLEYKPNATSRCSAALKEAYFIESANEIIYNLSNGNNYYHKTAKSNEKYTLFYSNAIFTIAEGVGVAFLNKENLSSLNIFLECSPENEINRRAARKENEPSKEMVLNNYRVRREQFELSILPYKKECQILATSLDNYDLEIVEDKLGVVYDD